MRLPALSRKLPWLVGSIIILALLAVVLYNLRITLELQSADRFRQAVEQLGKDGLELRLGGIYALEQIDRASERDHWPIIEILLAYVREHAPAEPGRLAQPPQRPAADIQAALSVIGRRRLRYEDGETNRVDLRQTDLRAANLSGAHLEGAILSGIHLERANLSGVHLEKAILRGTVLKNAVLTGARLNGAFLASADLTGAVLKDAEFEEAYLVGTVFNGADLRGANFKAAFGLTWEQVQSSLRDHTTRFPEGLKTVRQSELLPSRAD
jgi:hypothetical protein